MKHNLTIELQAKTDDFGGTFYVGRLDSPIDIDCSRGVAFFIFTAESGLEELQIAIAHPHANTNKHYFKNGKLKIKLETRPDGQNKTYFLGKIRENMRISFHAGGTFMVFASREGMEELQIDAQFVTGS